MATVNQNDLRIKNTINLLDSLKSNDHSYMFIGRPNQWETDVTVPSYLRNRTGDGVSPNPENNWKDFNRTWDQMIALKKITPLDVYPMITRVRWVSGITYDMYRHDYNKFNTSGTNSSNLYDSRFYVINSSKDVFVCLANNNNKPSTVEPINGISNQPFFTSDGYQWLKLYNLPLDNYNENKTNNYIPVVDNEVNSLPEGAIYTVVVESRGDFYSPPSISNPYYYCNINGDGTGAVARVTVQNSTIVDVRVSRNGSGYTVGTINFKANNVYGSLYDLDNNKNALNPGGDDRFKSSVIISPPGGWGYTKLDDSEEESQKALYTIMRQLGSVRVGVFTRLKFNENDFTTDTVFRQAGILTNLTSALRDNDQSSVITDDYYPETLAAYEAVKVTELQGSQDARYIVGETIRQRKKDPVNQSIEYEAKGTVVGWDDQRNIIRYIQDPTVHADSNGNLYQFSNRQLIYGETSEKESEPDVTYNLNIDSSDPVYNTINLQFTNGYARPEVDKYDGDMIYLVNLSPVVRNDRQSERMSFIISY